MTLQYVRDSKRQIYVSNATWRALRLIAKAMETTADELADGWLSDQIGKDYPEVIRHLLEVEKLERSTIKTINEINQVTQPS